MECGEQSVTMAGMKEMQLLSVSSWGLDNQVIELEDQLNLSIYRLIIITGMPVSQSFGAGMGPILLDNVACDQSHSELLQCVHPLDIGIHNCDQENIAGVICPNVSDSAITTATTNIHLLATNTQ